MGHPTSLATEPTDTGHPDSGILLVDESAWRTSGSVTNCWRATIRGGVLAHEGLVAKAPELLGVHWLIRGFD